MQIEAAANNFVKLYERSIFMICLTAVDINRNRLFWKQPLLMLRCILVSQFKLFIAIERALQAQYGKVVSY